MATNKEIDGHIMVRRNSTIGGNAKICGFATVGHDLRVEGWLDAPNIRGAGKGLYASEARLNEVHPHPEDGWWALVGDTLPADLYVAVDGKWVTTGKQAGEADIEFEQYVDALQAAQEKAESAEEASTQALRTANANTARIDDVEGDLSTLSTDYTTTKQYLLEAQNDIDILQSQMQAAQGEMSDIREECNNSIVGVTEQTDLKIAELRENAPVLSMAGIVNTLGEVGFSGRYATTYSHYFVNAESKFYYKPYGAEMPIVSPYPYNIAEGSMGNPSVMFAFGDTLYRLDEHPSDPENQMIKYIDAEDLDNSEASMRAVVTAVDSKVDDVDTRARILSEELNGGDIIININKEVGIEDGWFELDSAIANVPARYKYRCGLFITFLWQRPADGEKVWRTYQFKGCDSSGEQEEQWQDTSRWNQMADVRFVVENAMSRCSALEDSQREQDAKIAANTAAIDNHEKYLELVDAKKASFINVHAELPDYFGEPGLIGNNIRNVAYTLSMYGDKYATAGIVVKFFAGPGWQVWRYNGGGMTDEANWTQLDEVTAEQIDSLKSSQAEQDEKIAANTAMIENHEQYLEMVDSRCASYINVHAEFPDDFGEPGLIGNNIRNVAYVLSCKGERYQVAGLVVKFFGMGSWEIWRYDGGGLTDETHWTQLSEEEKSNSGTELREDIDKNTDAIATLKEQQAAYEVEQANIKASISDVEASISDVETQVNANATAIASLQQSERYVVWSNPRVDEFVKCVINGGYNSNGTLKSSSGTVRSWVFRIGNYGHIGLIAMRLYIWLCDDIDETGALINAVYSSDGALSLDDTKVGKYLVVSGIDSGGNTYADARRRVVMFQDEKTKADLDADERMLSDAYAGKLMRYAIADDVINDVPTLEWGEAANIAGVKHTMCLDSIARPNLNYELHIAKSLARIYFSCGRLLSIAPAWDASQVESLYQAFAECRSLVKADLSHCDFSVVKNCSEMFTCCISLTEVILPDMPNVTNWACMFEGCLSLKRLKLPPIYGGPANGMFWYCTSITEVSYEPNDSVELNEMFGVTNCKQMFDGGNVSLKRAKIPDLPLCTTINSMFGACTSLEYAEVGNAPLVTDARLMFFSLDANLKTVILGDMPSLTNGTQMFCGCRSLQRLTIGDISAVTKADYMFHSLPSLIYLTCNGTLPSIDLNLSTLQSLSYASLMSVLTHLPLVETSKTLSLHSRAKAKLSESDIAIATEKNWVIA